MSVSLRCGLALLLAPAVFAAGRTVVPLDGPWSIADSVQPDARPTRFDHTVPVPGLVHSAVPAFVDVDAFDSREVLQNRVKKGLAPASELVATRGRSRQERNYFWYRRAFTVPERRSVAMLRINKAQFGATVWLNGTRVGEHLPCFSAAIFDVTKAMRWTGENELVIRIGAHPGVLPDNVTSGTDFEKNRWTPGIYDSVSLTLSDGVSIETVQVAPQVSPAAITVETKLRNRTAAPLRVTLTGRVHEWKGSATVASAPPRIIALAPGEEKRVQDHIAVPSAKLWTPEAPNLYVLESSTGGDSVSTRFGVREFRFDTATKRAYLNGKVYFLRGSNITLHRFFEDPQSGTLPWDEKWVRKLMLEIPKELHWNAFRFCIGPAPDRWYDIADETGLLIQNEYFIWTGRAWHPAENQTRFDAGGLIQEYAEWMRDNWNHPSVAIWDATNETWDPIFADKVIPAVRKLDLSDRPWENSYNGPPGPDDPVEDHPYEFQNMAAGGPDFSMTTFEKPNAKAPGAPSGHAIILNEYGWLWLNRDGTPTELTKNLYPRLLGPNSTAEQRFELDAYLLAGITEYWRAYRYYAGVLHFVYLMSSDPLGYTADHFRNIASLELDPYFRDYMGQAFRPLGVNLSFWQPTLPASSSQQFTVMLVNDSNIAAEGTLSIVLESTTGTEVARTSAPFRVTSLGAETYYLQMKIPASTGDFRLKAVAEPKAENFGGATTSRRKVKIVAAH